MSGGPVKVAILIFDGVEELDFVGPWEVFTMAKACKLPVETVLVAERDAPVTCAKGMRVLPDTTFANARETDILVVPGGQGARRIVDEPAVMDFVTGLHRHLTLTTSVCTGAFVLARAGLLAGRRATTHWAQLDALSGYGPVGAVVHDERIVVDDAVITSAGVSAGIDMALAIIGRTFGPDHARTVQKWMEYYPEPPYADAASGKTSS